MATAIQPLITWSTDFDGSLERARNSGKHVLLDFSAAPMCTGCARLDAEVYNNPLVAALATTHFVPVRVHARDQKDEFARLGNRYDAQWTPTILVVSSDGTERYRIEGFLPAEDFLTQLMLGLGHTAFAAEQYKTAEERFRDVVEQHGFTDAAPEALYWAGVSRYKASHDPTALQETAKAFEKYPGSTWAKRASVWM